VAGSASSGAREGGGGGLLFAVTIVFVCLKLGGAVDWSWWIVLGPLWMPLALYLAVYAGMFVVLAAIVGCVMAARAVTPKRWWGKPVAAPAARERLLRVTPTGRRRKVYRVTTAQRRRR
jgi:hypothetical protein